MNAHRGAGAFLRCPWTSAERWLWVWGLFRFDTKLYGIYIEGSMENQTAIMEPTSTGLSKLATLKRITFTQAKALAAEKGVKLICESERVFRKCGRYTNTITNSWYKLSTLPDKKFYLLTDVRDFLLKGSA
jgi:hypothetical protein